MIANLEGAEQFLNTVDWEQLEKKHSIVIEGNRATVSSRQWLRGDKPLFTATAFLGTKAVDIKMQPHNNHRGSLIECDTDEILTVVESCVAIRSPLHDHPRRMGCCQEVCRRRIGAGKGAASNGSLYVSVGTRVLVDLQFSSEEALSGVDREDPNNSNKL